MSWFKPGWTEYRIGVWPKIVRDSTLAGAQAIGLEVKKHKKKSDIYYVRNSDVRMFEQIIVTVWDDVRRAPEWGTIRMQERVAKSNRYDESLFCKDHALNIVHKSTGIQDAFGEYGPLGGSKYER